MGLYRQVVLVLMLLMQHRTVAIPALNDSQTFKTTAAPKICPLPNLMKRNPVIAGSLLGALLIIAGLLVKMWSLANGGMLIQAGAITISFVFILVGAVRPRRAKNELVSLSHHRDSSMQTGKPQQPTTSRILSRRRFRLRHPPR